MNLSELFEGVNEFTSMLKSSACEAQMSMSMVPLSGSNLLQMATAWPV